MSFNICRGTLGRLAMFAAIQRATRRAVYSFAEPVLGVFFGARVARQPMTTNAIRTATKIPNCSMSTMLILRRPEWGGIKSCAGSLADLQSLVAPTGRIWRPRRCQSGFLLDLACGDSASGPVSYDQRGANNLFLMAVMFGLSSPALAAGKSGGGGGQSASSHTSTSPAWTHRGVTAVGPRGGVYHRGGT
jgi:hypothetical protein